jgi:hypothetical protein
MITYYLFYYREKKTVEHLTYKFASGTGSGGGYNPDYTSRINGYDLNIFKLYTIYLRNNGIDKIFKNLNYNIKLLIYNKFYLNII